MLRHPFILMISALCASSIAYNLLTIVAGWNFSRERRPLLPIAELPPVSVLKPLKGCDPQMYESFRSHCIQDFGEYELIFGVNDSADEAIPLVQRLQREFPAHNIKLMVCDKVLGPNRKVSNVVQMLAAAKHEHVVVNDSDIRVPSGYLREVISTLVGGAEQRVALVTCLYRGIPTNNLWSKLEALGVGADFTPACLAGRFVERGVHFGLGSTLAFTRQAERAIGGLITLVDHLADDYELSAALLRMGHKTELAKTVVDTFVTDYTFRGFLDHQLRWGRAVRVSRPASYIGFLPMFGLLWSLVLLVATGGHEWAWIAMGVFVLARLASVYFVSYRVAGDRRTWRSAWLLAIRDLLSPMIWVASLFGNTIVWRGDTFTLNNGKLHRIR